MIRLPTEKKKPSRWAYVKGLGAGQLRYRIPEPDIMLPLWDGGYFTKFKAYGKKSSVITSGVTGTPDWTITANGTAAYTNRPAGESVHFDGGELDYINNPSMFIVVVRTTDTTLHAVVASHSSSSATNPLWMFQLEDVNGNVGFKLIIRDATGSQRSVGISGSNPISDGALHVVTGAWHPSWSYPICYIDKLRLTSTATSGTIGSATTFNRSTLGSCRRTSESYNITANYLAFYEWQGKVLTEQQIFSIVNDPFCLFRFFGEAIFGGGGFSTSKYASPSGVFTLEPTIVKTIRKIIT